MGRGFGVPLFSVLSTSQVLKLLPVLPNPGPTAVLFTL